MTKKQKLLRQLRSISVRLDVTYYSGKKGTPTSKPGWYIEDGIPSYLGYNYAQAKDLIDGKAIKLLFGSNNAL